MDSRLPKLTTNYPLGWSSGCCILVFNFGKLLYVLFSLYFTHILGPWRNRVTVVLNCQCCQYKEERRIPRNPAFFSIHPPSCVVSALLCVTLDGQIGGRLKHSGPETFPNQNFWFEFPSQLRPAETLVGEHFSYNFLVENETTAHWKLFWEQN